MNTEETVVLNKLLQACRSGAMSPSNSDLAQELRKWRIDRTLPEVEAIIDSLSETGKIEVYARKKESSRWFAIPWKDHATVCRKKFKLTDRPAKPPQPKAEALPLAMPTRPVPLVKADNAYDLNLKLGAPIRIVGRPDSQRPMPRVTTPHMPTHSECGCAAAMAVAS